MSLHYPKKKILISLHGIRTRGEWQKNLCPLVSEKGWKYYPLDYGFFRAWKLAIGYTHKAKVQWFRDRINQIKAENPDALPSIIVHSFGSLILAKALEQYPDLTFDRVILTGSIIPVDFPWEKIRDRKQVSYVRNIVGQKDLCSKVAAYIPGAGAGNSGAVGFCNDQVSDILEDVQYDEFGHSDAHLPDVFKARVIPFLEDAGLPTNAPKANYLTHVDPFEAACWTVVSYVRQFVRRFENSIRSNDFHFRHGDEVHQLDKPPKGLIILIPDLPSGATPGARDELEKSLDLKRIVFSQRARSALIGKDQYAYDLPSALESFNVYVEVFGQSTSSESAMDYFQDILRDAIKQEYGSRASAPKVMKLSEVITKKTTNNV